MFFDEDRGKRTLGIRDKQILYRRANKKCENPSCGRELDFDEMQTGHMRAWSKGGATTLANSKCLCYRCNKLQGTDSWAVFLKKQGTVDPKAAMKKAVKVSLEALNMRQLKSLADEHKIKVLGRIDEGLFESHRLAPSKRQYVSKLSGLVTIAELKSVADVQAPKSRVRR